MEPGAKDGQLVPWEKTNPTWVPSIITANKGAEEEEVKLGPGCNEKGDV